MGSAMPEELSGARTGKQRGAESVLKLTSPTRRGCSATAGYTPRRRGTLPLLLTMADYTPRIRVIDAFPEMAWHLDEDGARLARQHALATLRVLQPGTWHPRRELQP